MIAALLQQILRSRLALMGLAGGSVGLVGAASVRLIPWTMVLVIIVLAVVGVIAFLYLRQWWGRRKDAAFAAAMDAQGAGAKGQARLRDRAQIEELQAKWKEQFAALQRSKVGKQKRFVYFLPWYVIIGAPACGKTTAIENSGLTFPGGAPKLKGTGGTKNCDWWFAEQALLLDTAGRYAFNEDNAPDLDEWIEFLKLLKKNRPIAPINGLIVAVAADELLGKDEDAVVENARTIRDKLDQLVRELGIQFPVYLLVTKCDLVEGFAEFFGRLPQNRLGEMLGWTNPSWEVGDPRALVGEALSGLGDRVRGMRPELLRGADQREAQRAIYVFPEEFRTLEERLVVFGDVLFRETQYNESPFLRGIYFTSGIQKGTAVSSMLMRLGFQQASELPEQKRSFFLKDFFSIRLPADKNLVATTGRVRGRAQVVNNLGLAVIATLSILFGVVTGGSYVANRTLLNDLEDEMRAASGTEQRPPAETLAALERYVGVIERLDDRNRRRPLLAGWGLWTGDRVIDPARKLFLDRFDKDAYRPSTGRAREALKTRDEQRGFPGLEALIRNYVYGKQIADGRQVTGTNDALASFWNASGEVAPETATQFGRGYLAYLAWRAPEGARAEQASDIVLLREALPELFTVDRVADWTDRARCTVDGTAKSCYPALRARDVGVPIAIANEAQVRGAFRTEAWPGHVEPLVTAVESLGNEIDADVVPRFRENFRARYYDEWLRFLGKPKVVGDRDVSVDTQLGAETPYLKIVDTVSGAMTFDAGTGKRPPWADGVTRVMAKRVEYLANLTAVSKQVKGGRADPPAALDDARGIYQRRAAVSDDDGDPPPDPFGKLERWVRQAVRRTEAVDAEDTQARVRVEELLTAPMYEGFRVYVEAAATAIDQQWQRRIGAMPTESCPDIQALYRRPGGAIPEFFATVMEPFYESGYIPKVRYRARLERSMSWLPSKEAQVRKNCGEGGGGGGGSEDCNVFFRAVPAGATTEGIYATHTVLRIYCGDGDPQVLDHRNNPASLHIVWKRATCSRAEVSVAVGHDPSDERPLDPRGADSLPDLLRAASQQGNRFVWEFPQGAKAIFEVTQTPPNCLFRSTEGTKPPGVLPRQ